MSKFRNFIVILGAGIALAGCFNRADTYTLYRTSPFGVARIHVATFDAIDGEGYNKENCDITAKLFMQQPGVKVTYWCEKGEFKA